VAGGELPVRHQLLEGRGEVQKPHGVGHGAAGFAHTPCGLLLGHVIGLNQGLVTGGLLHGVQVLPLEVFDQAKFHHLAVVRLDDDGGDLLQVRQTGGPPPPLSGDDLVVTGGQLPDGQGLYHSVLADGLRQLLQLFLVKVFPGLIAAAFDLGHGQGRGGGGKIHGEIISQQCAQALAHAFFLCHRDSLLSNDSYLT